ncbi:RsmF rRNA methyltransferase first C-terminal domain-containing protein [Bacillus xiapuensis]|uniref:RsmF rRNA methyltransferase first C-terminal domain-containing protein n=1 Tax=Bacillus xiapuensis TaxID=2014075 RepID=A0ABU6NBT9_9BACI|nr:RsmF rRNA methyltransferase first C-terminal domain-containing protein [Bacillus xiapuensis]
MQLPSEFIRKFTDLLEEESKDFFHTYEESKMSGLRLNPLKISEEEWAQQSPFTLKKIPFVPNGFYYDSERDQPGKHPYHAAGLYYIQEPSAMFVAEQLAPTPGEKVLDLCAAPGGKSTQLAGKMAQRGILVANEINSKRAKALSENIERLGISNVLVTNETPERLAERFQGYFDKILVDAPCSGEGMFRKDVEAIAFWSEAHVEACAKQQKNILDSAYSMLKEGGILVYSTCTFSPEENEQTIEYFLKKYPDLQLLPIEKTNGIQTGRPEWSNSNLNELEKTARLWPHHLRGEGHFVAKIRKTAVPAPSRIKEMTSNASRTQLKDFYEFSNQTIDGKTIDHFYLFNQQLYALPDQCPSFQGLKILRAGLHLGELKKNRFEPNHALALGLKTNEAKHCYTLKDDEWFHYLKGETLTTENDRGWMLVTIDGYPLGWGKEAKGILKNFYPKGLRIQA